MLRSEQERITAHLKNNGYYQFAKNYISYQIDTIGRGHQADLIISIDPIILDNGRTIDHRRQYISQVAVFPNHNGKQALTEGDDYYNDTDTTVYNFDGNPILFVRTAYRMYWVM